MTISLTFYGQACDTIDGKLINCTDTAGLRQGYWELTKKKILVSGYHGLGSDEGCGYIEKAEFYLLAKGEYKDNRKIGTWEYYSGDSSTSLERITTYYEDGSIKDKDLLDRYIITINSDTSEIKGQLYHDLDTLRIECYMKTCSIRLSDGQTIMNFEFSDMHKLKFELLRLQLGVYNREIEMIKDLR